MDHTNYSKDFRKHRRIPPPQVLQSNVDLKRFSKLIKQAEKHIEIDDKKVNIP